MTGLALKYLTDEMYADLRQVKAQCGFTIDDIVRSGRENPDGDIGAYAGDEDCYNKFAPLFDKIIEDYHGYLPADRHDSNLNVADLPAMEHLDPRGEAILSTRIRVARNISDFAFPPAVSAADRAKIEQCIVTELNNLQGEFTGTYFPLSDMDEATRIKLTGEHFLFKKGDRFLESAGVNRDWPDNRGIFLSTDKRFLVWVNEEDELRIISMQFDGDLREVFARLVRAISALEAKIPFAHNDHLGYLTSCPTNLGTALRASFHVRLPYSSKRPEFKSTCEELGLSVRGIHGEHTESEGGVYDISNKQRLGISEVACIERLYSGTAELLAWERRLALKV